MAGSAPPLTWQAALFLLLLPPVGACLWRLMARGWALGTQRGRVSDRVQRWERLGFWALLWAAYAVEACVFAYAALKR